MSLIQKVALMGSLAASAYAHGRIISITAGGEEYEGFTSAMASGQSADGIIAWSADNQDNGFVGPDSYSSSDIACHKNGAPGGKAAKVEAGGEIKLQWDTWPESHHGPVLDYLAKCAGDDCSSVTAGDLSFFKIDEAGLNDASAQDWASDDLIAADNSWTVTIPESLAPGQYVLRHEIIALHSAQDANGAQNYPQCINIEVTGSGSAEPSGVAATELYSADDAGISLSIYNDLTDYEIPGPAVWDGASTGGSSSSGSSGSSSGSSSAAASSGSAPATSAAASSSVAAPSANASSADATSAAAPTSAAAATTSAPKPTGESSNSGSDSGACTTTVTITATASASATSTSAPIDTSDNSSDDDEDYEEEEETSSNSGSSSSGSSNNTPTTTSSPAADISAVASSLPSSVLDAPVSESTGSSESSGSDSGRPKKDLPEGFTLKDLLAWVNYLLKKAGNSEGLTRRHARDIFRF